MKKNYSKPEVKVNTISLTTYMEASSPSSPVGGETTGDETFSSKEHLLDGLFD